MTEIDHRSEIDDLFDFIMKVQEKVAPQVATRKEFKEGEGRKGILMIRGPQKWVKVFEVRGGQIVFTENTENVRTVIAFDSLEIFREVCNNLLAGHPMAFARARARGSVKVEGEFALRDATIFNRLLSKVGQILKSYDVKLGEG